MDRSGTGSYQKRASTTSRRQQRTTDHNVGMLDSLSSASLMEVASNSFLSMNFIDVLLFFMSFNFICMQFLLILTLAYCHTLSLRVCASKHGNQWLGPIRVDLKCIDWL